MGAFSIAPPLGPRHPHAVAPLADGDGAAITPHAPFRLDLDVPTAARFVDHHTRPAGTDAYVDVGLRQPSRIGPGGSGTQRPPSQLQASCVSSSLLLQVHLRRNDERAKIVPRAIATPWLEPQPGETMRRQRGCGASAGLSTSESGSVSSTIAATTINAVGTPS